MTKRCAHGWLHFCKLVRARACVAQPVTRHLRYLPSKRTNLAPVAGRRLAELDKIDRCWSFGRNYLPL